MKLILLLFIFFLTGCATKYMLPGNRFMTPESQGGALTSQVEFQQAKATRLYNNVSNSSSNGVDYEPLTRSGFLFSTSLLDPIDIFWSHVGGGNSLLGIKYQFLGTSRLSKGTGHKMAISAGFGSNEHKTVDQISFELAGKEYQLLYGYRFNEMFLIYSNFSYATYNFKGDIVSSDPAINSLKLNNESSLKSLLSGIEFSIMPFTAKVEIGYQLISTTNSKGYSNFVYGYSLGFSF